MTGRINSFLTLSAIDGPGLRFVLFMQGCKLRCIYCHNPDTWIYENGKIISSEEIIDNINQYKDFYTNSSGGLTITGGEPFYQPEFIEELLTLAKNNNYHTAIDTSGSEDISKYDEIIKNTDLFILDIKALDKNKYHEITGDKTENSSKNGLFLSSINKKLWIRYVIVPGFNDSESDIDNLIKYLKQLKTLERVQIIPFSKIGFHKWNDLGYINILENTEIIKMEKVTYIKNKISTSLKKNIVC